MLIMDTPLVTVLMSVYNAEPFLEEAMNSILEQTYENLEFLIINDASEDRSLKIIQSYSDPRIVVVNNKENIKLTRSLNKGIKLVKGKYIARMDADDVSLPTRIEKQVTYMERHAEVGLCGTFLRTFGLNMDYDIAFKTTHDEIKFKLFFDTHFPHPAAMLRKSVLEIHQLKYDTDHKVAQDYELWNTMVEYCEVAILPEVLVRKRSHGGQTSAMQKQEQLNVLRIVHKQLFQNLGVVPSEDELDIYEKYLTSNTPKDKKSLFILLDLFDKLIKGNVQFRIYNDSLFNVFFANAYWSLCTTSTHLGLSVYSKFMHSYSQSYTNVSRISSQKLLLKSLIHYQYG